MYQFSGKLKTLSIALIILGALGIAYGFYSAPKTVEEAKEIIAHQSSHGDDHGNAHGNAHGAADSEVTSDKHAHVDHHDAAHDEHVFHQLQNKPWSALYVSLFFFLGVTLLVLAFYAIQRVAQAGWSIVLFRVMEAITANLVPTSIIMLFVVIAAAMPVSYTHLTLPTTPYV